jgi:hypothetical protein
MEEKRGRIATGHCYFEGAQKKIHQCTLLRRKSNVLHPAWTAHFVAIKWRIRGSELRSKF